MEVTYWNLHYEFYFMEVPPWKLPHGTYTKEVTSRNLHQESYLVEVKP